MKALIFAASFILSASSYASSYVNFHVCTGNYDEGEIIEVRIFENENNFCQNSREDKKTMLYISTGTENVDNTILKTVKSVKRTNSNLISHKYKGNGYDVELLLNSGDSTAKLITTGKNESQGEQEVHNLVCDITEMWDVDC